ncbi:MAG: DMT family transporter [Chloroflexota bacterium]
MKHTKLDTHKRAVLQALFVTFLWSTSWVLIKIGLADIPALTFAGLRYSLAFICLLAVMLRPANRVSLRRLTRRQWGLLVLLGVIYCAIVQGAQFVGLAYLPAATASLLLNFTSIVVALMGVMWLGESPGLWGWMGTGLSAVGALIYFYPPQFPSAQVFGLAVVCVGVIANAVSSVLGRYINHHENIPALLVTTASMGTGGLLLLAAGGLWQGVPVIKPSGWAIIAWLALVNTAWAFYLWNLSLRSLSAVESSVINNSMLIQIALLAWLILGEELSLQKWGGMLLAGLGVMLVNLRGAPGRKRGD